MCENETEPDFWFGAPFASYPASNIAILAILGVFYLRGCFELFKEQDQSGRKLPRQWQTRLGKYSPDAQDFKKCMVGYPAGTLWWSAGPKSKISESL